MHCANSSSCLLQVPVPSVRMMVIRLHATSEHHVNQLKPRHQTTDSSDHANCSQAGGCKQQLPGLVIQAAPTQSVAAQLLCYQALLWKMQWPPLGNDGVKQTPTNLAAEYTMHACHAMQMNCLLSKLRTSKSRNLHAKSAPHGHAHVGG